MNLTVGKAAKMWLPNFLTRNSLGLLWYSCSQVTEPWRILFYGVLWPVVIDVLHFLLWWQATAVEQVLVSRLVCHRLVPTSIPDSVSVFEVLNTLHSHSSCLRQTRDKTFSSASSVCILLVNCVEASRTTKCCTSSFLQEFAFSYRIWLPS